MTTMFLKVDDPAAPIDAFGTQVLERLARRKGWQGDTLPAGRFVEGPRWHRGWFYLVDLPQEAA